MRQIDIKGNRYGKWVVLQYMGNRGWLCRCDCGVDGVVQTANLKAGKSTKCRDCGALRGGGKNKLPIGEANFNDKYANCKAGAKQRGLAWELTKEEAKEIFQGNCFYCGVPPLQIWHHTETNGHFLNNGIDRIDSDKGYLKENCVSCCKKCNYMKRTMSVDDFLSHIQRIVEYLQL